MLLFSWTWFSISWESSFSSTEDKSEGVVRGCCCSMLLLLSLFSACARSRSARTALCVFKWYKPGFSGSKSPSISTSSTTKSSWGGGRFNRTDIQPPSPASRSRSMHLSTGCSEKALARTLTVLPNGTRPVCGLDNSTSLRITAPIGNVTRYTAGTGKGSGCATIPRCPERGFKSSEHHPSTGTRRRRRRMVANTRPYSWHRG
mmetsp:Transcript_14229/g.30156  ORF Transcript_14229/g.30156 Transcript_14229/m.30156 type:complete len:203 (+) Transcript_14229:2886-3494(+)